MTTFLTKQSSTLGVQLVRALHGPNIWSRRPVLELQMDTCDFSFADWHVADELLVTLGLEPVGSNEYFGAEALANWFSAAVIQLQIAAGSPVSYRTWCGDNGSDACRIVVEFEEERLGCAVIETLRRWLNSVARREPLAVNDEWTPLLEWAYDVRLGNTTGAITTAATARGIPFLRLDDESLVQLGQGRQQRRVRMATTDRTGAIANCIATDKQLTKRLLHELGIPVPLGHLVSNALDARRAADELGWPVVVKPADADYGDGVSIRLTSAEQVTDAYAAARRWSERVLVERFVPGILYRLLVVGDRLVAAVRRESAFVVGDGQHTVLELVDEATHDPHRGANFVSPWRRSAFTSQDTPSLALGGVKNDQVPAAGETVALAGDIYLRNGGIQVDRTSDVHPDIVTLAIDTAKIVGLDIAGLDVIAEDLSRSPREQSFAVLEVNAEPAIVLHLASLCSPPSPVAEAIVESLFGAGQTGRVPLIAVLGSPRNVDVAQRMATEKGRSGKTVGLASRGGAWLNGRSVGASCDRIRDHTRRLWRHPRTDIVVVHLTLADILREGVPFSHCDQLIETDAAHEPVAAESECSESDQRRALACLRSCLWPAN